MRKSPCYNVLTCGRSVTAFSAPPRSQRPGQGPRSPHPNAGPAWGLPPVRAACQNSQSYAKRFELRPCWNNIHDTFPTWTKPDTAALPSNVISAVSKRVERPCGIYGGGVKSGAAGIVEIYFVSRSWRIYLALVIATTVQLRLRRRPLTEGPTLRRSHHQRNPDKCLFLRSGNKEQPPNKGQLCTKTDKVYCRKSGYKSYSE
jgi:hypothetical protein